MFLAKHPGKAFVPGLRKTIFCLKYPVQDTLPTSQGSKIYKETGYYALLNIFFGITEITYLDEWSYPDFSMMLGVIHSLHLIYGTYENVDLKQYYYHYW